MTELETNPTSFAAAVDAIIGKGCDLGHKSFGTYLEVERYLETQDERQGFRQAVIALAAAESFQKIEAAYEGAGPFMKNCALKVLGNWRQMAKLYEIYGDFAGLLYMVAKVLKAVEELENKFDVGSPVHHIGQTLLELNVEDLDNKVSRAARKRLKLRVTSTLKGAAILKRLGFGDVNTPKPDVEIAKLGGLLGGQLSDLPDWETAQHGPSRESEVVRAKKKVLFTILSAPCIENFEPLKVICNYLESLEDPGVSDGVSFYFPLEGMRIAVMAKCILVVPDEGSNISGFPTLGQCKDALVAIRRAVREYAQS